MDNLLAFVIPGQQLKAIFYFKKKNKDNYRDIVELSNCQAAHKKVRQNEEKRLKAAMRPQQDSDSIPENHNLPVLIEEGWNTFKFETNESSLMLVLTTGKEDVLLLKLPMDYPIDQVHVIGNFSVCSGGKYATFYEKH